MTSFCLSEGIWISSSSSAPGCFLAHVAVIGHRDKPEEAARHFLAQEDVGAHIQVFRQGEILIDGFDAAAANIGGRVIRDILAIEFHPPLIRAIHTRDALDQGGLARAVIAEQGDHFARVDLKVHLVNSGQAAEELAHAGGGKDRFRHCFPIPL